MPLITEQTLRNRVQNEMRKSFDFPSEINNKARYIINEGRKPAISGIDVYDIFLSHSSDDAVKVAGLKLLLEDFGYRVYVDWIEDPLMSRKNVTKDTALKLKERMTVSTTLIYAFSENSQESRWMPWELGYFDGIKSKVAVMPISNKTQYDFKGTEYLGIYYYITIDTALNTNTEYLWLHETTNKYVRFDWWKNNNQQPYVH